MGEIEMSECEACGHKKTDGYYNSNDITNTIQFFLCNMRFVFVI